MRNILLAAALAGASFPSAFAQSKMGGDPNPGVIRQQEPDIYRKFCQQLPAGAGAAEVANAILHEYPQLKASGCELGLASLIESPGGFHYLFDQTVNGIPVYGASIKANLLLNYRFINLLNNLRTFPMQTPAAFTQTAAQAETAARAYFTTSTPAEVRSRQVYFLKDGVLIPAWEVYVLDYVSAYELLLNGNDLSLISRRDLASYCHGGGGGQGGGTASGAQGTQTVTVDGTGMVFNPDPLTTAGQQYITGWKDQSDADNANLNGQRQSVTLMGITQSGNNYLLEGPHVRIVELESPTVSPVTSTDGTFNYTRSQSGFEDVNCYYHIDHYQRYIQSLGFNNLANFPIRVDPHGLSGADNSHFVPNGSNSYLAFGEGGVDDAEDADVVIHEYGHALSYSGSPNSNSGFERQGQDEGTGDYLATSYSHSLNTFRWDDMFTWDGHNEFWNGRDMTIAQQYPYSGGDFYRIGEIWASTLMQVYRDANGGATPTDKNFFQELFMNSANQTLNDAAHLMIDADTMNYGGSHTAVYQQYFCQRGIFTGPECVVAVDPAAPDANLGWQVYPNPATESITLNLAGLQQTQDVHYRVVDMAGRTVLEGTTQGAINTLDTRHLDRGMYLIYAEQNGNSLGVKKLALQ